MKERARKGVLDQMLTRKQIRMLLDFSLDDEFSCDACAKSKNKMKANPKKSLTVTNKPGHLVVSDASGPFSHGLGYYILVMDVHTTFTMVTWVPSLTERTLSIVERFFVHSLYCYYPQVFRCDRGSNYTAKLFVDGIMDFGTQVQHADTGAHWQNGFVSLNGYSLPWCTALEGAC